MIAVALGALGLRSLCIFGWGSVLVSEIMVPNSNSWAIPYPAETRVVGRIHKINVMETSVIPKHETIALKSCNLIIGQFYCMNRGVDCGILMFLEYNEPIYGLMELIIRNFRQFLINNPSRR